jgi:hypothetical protein
VSADAALPLLPAAGGAPVRRDSRNQSMACTVQTIMLRAVVWVTIWIALVCAVTVGVNWWLLSQLQLGSFNSARFWLIIITIPLLFGIFGGAVGTWYRWWIRWLLTAGMGLVGSFLIWLSSAVAWVAYPGSCGSPAGSDCDNGLAIGLAIVASLATVPLGIGLLLSRLASDLVVSRRTSPQI